MRRVLENLVLNVCNQRYSATKNYCNLHYFDRFTIASCKYITFGWHLSSQTLKLLFPYSVWMLFSLLGGAYSYKLQFIEKWLTHENNLLISLSAPCFYLQSALYSLGYCNLNNKYHPKSHNQKFKNNILLVIFSHCVLCIFL